MPEKNAPLTVEEMTEASEHFAALFTVVRNHFPEGSVEDCLKIMESVAKYAHSQRAKKREEEAKLKFGFNKNKEDADA